MNPESDKKNKLRPRLLAAICACLLPVIFPLRADAAIVNVDFQPSGSTTYTGQGIFGGVADTHWNAVNEGSASNLALSDGASSSISVSSTFGQSYSNLPSSSNALLADRLYGTPADATQTITLSGLTANAAFNIALYNGFYAQQYSIEGQPSISASIDPVAAGSANIEFMNWGPGAEYVTLNSVMSDSNGNIVISVNPLDGITAYHPKNSAIAGLQLQSLPVPAAVWLFGSGLLCLIAISKRKKV